MITSPAKVVVLINKHGSRTVITQMIASAIDHFRNVRIYHTRTFIRAFYRVRGKAYFARGFSYTFVYPVL